jgi:hypothetical protein
VSDRDVPLTEESLSEIDRGFERCEKLRPQLAYLALLYLAESTESPTIFTLDRRDFSVMQRRSACGLTLLPEILP